jgi:AcrR family transcriptional regulator
MRQRAPKRPAAERKRLILESAQTVFAESGYANSGTEQVARAAGVSASALYRYFPSKRDLYLATLSNAGPRLQALWAERAQRAPDPLEAIRLLGLEYYDHLRGRSSYARLWFQALGDADDPDVRAAIAANFTGMVDVISGLVAAAQERGLARNDVDPRIAAWHFMAIGFTFDLVHHLALDDELDRDRVESWGRLYIDSLREASHEPSATNSTPATGRALPVRQPGRADRPGRGGDPLQEVPASAPNPLGDTHGGGADG